jgi:two-component system chemotaxis response regulator CheY
MAEDVDAPIRSGLLGMPEPSAFVRRSVTRARPANDRIRVLVVEPAPVLRHIITHALSVQGYTLATAQGVRDFEALLSSFDPHIVVSELHLPDGSGEHICHVTRARASKLVPVVLMSGTPEPELARRGRSAAADRCFSKSHGLSALLEMIDELTAEILF